MNNLQKYHEHVQRRKQVRVWIKHEGERVVADALFHLNRHIGISPYYRSEVYFFKKLLIEFWYRHCLEVHAQTQTLSCYACDGTGNDWHDEPCWKCDGSGIYAVHTLYHFIFTIAGKRYQWHQPSSQVDYPITLSDHEPSSYQAKARSDEVLLSGKTFKIYFYVLGEYLITNAVIPGYDFYLMPKSYVHALYSDIWSWLNNTWLGWKVYRFRKQFLAWRYNLKRFMHYLETGESTPDIAGLNDDFPF